MYSRYHELKFVREKTSLKYEYDGEGISQSRAGMRLSDGMNSFTNTLSKADVHDHEALPRRASQG